jgi:glutamyl-tRNA synthetase
LIWQALSDVTLPAFAHLPVLVNEKRQKLSKRRDRVAVEDYRNLGFLPEAMINYLCLLGWSPKDDRELLTVDEMISEFSLGEVNKSPAFFDEKRLAHFNGLYIRALSTQDFIERALPFVVGEHARWPEERFRRDLFDELAPLVQERISTLGEIPGYVAFLFADPFVVDETAFEKAVIRDELAITILEAARDAYAKAEFVPDTLKEILISIGEQHARKLAKTQAPVRVATMGSAVGLPLFESLMALGREEVLSRLNLAIDTAQKAK